MEKFGIKKRFISDRFRTKTNCTKFIRHMLTFVRLRKRYSITDKDLLQLKRESYRTLDLCRYILKDNNYIKTI